VGRRDLDVTAAMERFLLAVAVRAVLLPCRGR
jgi:hypothetical protein